MAKKDDLGEQLKAREERRKSSVVSNMISAQPIQLPEPAPEKQESEAGTKKVTDKAMKKSEPGWELKKIDVKSIKKTFTLYPSVNDRAMEKCKRIGISLNHAINELLEKWADTE